MSMTTQHRFQLWGWILFVFSAIFFMVASLRAGDLVSLIGGLLFLLACFVFLTPLLAELRASSNSLSQQRKYSRYLPGWFRAANLRWHAPGAPLKLPVPAHQQDQIQRHQVRSELRFFASTR